ncbi:MAG: maleate isomerase [Acetobacteraceae bacterium]|jgi:maleate isomerase|nr:maleate isomerase [Acetobacteraceae bacterium]
MSDVLGWRHRFGVLGPSTNTVVQPDLEAMRPVGVTNHYSRIYTPNAAAVSNESFMAGATVIGDNTIDAVSSVMTSAPDSLVMAMSAVTFFGGIADANKFQASIEQASGLQVSIGSHASAAALRAYGDVRRVAFMSPYFPTANAEVRRYLEESGFTVVRDRCLQCPSWTAIATIRPNTIRDTFRELEGDDVDAILQVGTNLSAMRLCAAAELWLGKPVIAINTAIYWHALRTQGIQDKIAGFGRLLEEF